MSKQRFMRFLNEELKEKTIEEKVAYVQKILNEHWLQDYTAKLTKNLIFCTKCKKYSLIKSFKHTSSLKVSHDQCVYQDCGYGDNDEFADVTYRVFYEVCPKCGHKQEISRTCVEISNRRDRYGNKA